MCVFYFCSNYLTTILQDKVFYLAKSCIESELCSQLGTIQESDNTIKESHEFGQQSVPYNQFKSKYPNLPIPVDNENSKFTDTAENNHLIKMQVRKNSTLGSMNSSIFVLFDIKMK